ncbi:MAG: hypothetical protein K0R80_1098 [Clostridia bacterium]|nr:hypothetical protein [Clostridia bacterium]
MIKNKAAKALIIGACLTLSSMAGVYADTNNVEVKPAIIQEVNDESEIMTIQIAAVNNEDVLSKKQMEIDQYVFEQHQEELEKKGIIVTSTGVVGDVVEVSITPYDVKNADYLYELFGEDMVKVVAGEQAVPLDLVTTADISAQSGMAVEKEASFFETFFKGIVEWFKSIF